MTVVQRAAAGQHTLQRGLCYGDWPGCRTLVNSGLRLQGWLPFQQIPAQRLAVRMLAGVDSLRSCIESHTCALYRAADTNLCDTLRSLLMALTLGQDHPLCC